jgi:hypothetical protein
MDCCIDMHWSRGTQQSLKRGIPAGGTDSESGCGMFCSGCGFILQSQQGFCPICGKAITVAAVPATGIPPRTTSAETRLWNLRLWVGIGCVVLGILFTSSLQHIAGWIGIICSVLFAIGWSIKAIQFRHKIAFVILSVILVTGVQSIEAVQAQKRAAMHQAELNRITEQRESAVRLRLQQEEDAFNNMTPAQHLAVAKEILKPDTPDDRIAEGMKHLQAVQGTPLEAQGTALRMHYEAQKAQARRVFDIEAAKSMKRATEESERQEILGRDAMAKSIENGMLSEGYDVDVNAIGANHTTLRIRFILVNKAFAYQTAHSPDIINSARDAGFKKLVLTDGYDEQWHIDL